MENNMKQFNLQEYLKNPERKVVTRDGRKVRIICTDRKGLDVKPIVALITLPNCDEIVKCFWSDGIEMSGEEDKNDLFFVPEKHEGWINLPALLPEEQGGEGCNPLYKVCRRKEGVFAELSIYSALQGETNLTESEVGAALHNLRLQQGRRHLHSLLVSFCVQVLK